MTQDTLGFECFVAHVDIHPGAEWIHEIRLALASCDALVALVTDDFKGSDWCSQEVGWALGRSVPLVPVRLGASPYGLFGAIQAITWPEPAGARVADVADEVVNTLVSDQRTALLTTDALVRELENANSFKQANALSNKLVELAVKLTPLKLRGLKQLRPTTSTLEGHSTFPTRWNH